MVFEIKLKNTIVFAEAGSYPFGRDLKQQAAKTLIIRFAKITDFVIY